MNVLIDVLIGCITASFIILIFRKVEQKRIVIYWKIQSMFIGFVLLCSIIYQPSQSSEHICLWFGLSLLFYSVLDDLLTKTIDIKIPIIVTIIFYAILRNPYDLLISFFIFFIILLFVKLSKEHFVGEGDAYILLPLMVFCGIHLVFIATYISILLGIVLLTGVELKRKEPEYAFVPFFVLGFILVTAEFYVPAVSVVLTGLFFLCAPILLFLSKKEEKK